MADDALRARMRERLTPERLSAAHEAASLAYVTAHQAGEPQDRCIWAFRSAFVDHLVPALAEDRQNETLLFQRLSSALTGGNAATWDEVLHAAEALAEEREAQQRTSIELPDAVSVKMLQNEVAVLTRRLKALAARLAEVEKFLDRQGYRRCDIPACNCPYWHGGDANERLREVSDLLADAGVPGGTTVYGGVLMLRERAQAAEAKLAEVERRLTGRIDDYRSKLEYANANLGVAGLSGFYAEYRAVLKELESMREALKADALRAAPKQQEPGR